MSINLAQGRPTSAYSYVAPFASGRAVDGNLQPTNRWLCGTVPAWMSVNLQGEYYINRWVVRNMGAAGWQSPNYNMNSYKLQGSYDNTNWFDIDSVAGNSISVTDRTINTVRVNYVRVYVTNGLNINPKMASIVELEVYGGTTPYLSNLALSTGTLTPAFNSAIFNYTSTVPNSVSTIKLTPTATDSQATITVNGVPVVSGSASQDIPLNVGTNTINVVVTSRVGSMQQAYTVVVTRASSSLLANLVPSVGTLVPGFSSTVISYTDTVANNVSTIKLTPTAADSQATITVNGVAVANGTASQDIPLNVGANNVSVVVTSKIGGVQQVYTVVVTRQEAIYLTGLEIKAASVTLQLNPAFSGNSIFNYTTNAASTVSVISVKPTAESSDAVITVNGVSVASGSRVNVTLLGPGQLTKVTINVTSSDGTKNSIYEVDVLRASS